MISTIELGYDDEPLFGLIGRLMNRVERRARCEFAKWLFGRRTYIPHPDFPSRIDNVVEKLTVRVGMSAEEVIDKMSMLPVISPFIESERVTKLVEDMRGSDVSAIVGVMWRRTFNRGTNRALRFCEQCRRRDLRRHPHAWWRRVHQVPGVVCCPHCGGALSISQFGGIVRSLHQYVLVEDAVVIGKEVEPDPLDRFVAEQVLWLLQRPHATLREAFSFRDVFRQRLNELGFVRSDRLCRREFTAAFFAQRTAEAWRSRGIEFNPNSGQSWPEKVAQSYNGQRTPLFFLLVMKFLGLTVEAAITAANDPTRKRAPRGRWRPMDLETEKLIRRRWNDPTVRFWNIAKEAGLSPARLGSVAIRLNLPLPRRAHAMEWRVMKHRRDAARRMFLDKETPDDVRRATKWLQRWDRAWLAQRRRAPKPGIKKIDWAKREAELIPHVDYVVARIKSMRPFRRVCPRAIADQAHYGTTLFKTLHRMPKLRDHIDQHVETPLQFMLRRILTLKRMHPELTPSHLRMRASVLNKHPAILRALGYHLVGDTWYSSPTNRRTAYGLKAVGGGMPISPSKRQRDD